MEAIIQETLEDDLLDSEILRKGTLLDRRQERDSGQAEAAAATTLKLRPNMTARERIAVRPFFFLRKNEQALERLRLDLYHRSCADHIT